MDHEATHVLEKFRVERPTTPNNDGPDLFIKQLTEQYSDGDSTAEAEAPLEIVTPPSALHKPGWFNKG